MKLYTEEELKKAYIEGHRRGWSRAVYMHTGRTNKDADEFLNENNLTPIELPSDEEIEERAERNINKYSFIDGVEWLRDKITGVNK